MWWAFSDDAWHRSLRQMHGVGRHPGDLTFEATMCYSGGWWGQPEWCSSHFREGLAACSTKRAEGRSHVGAASR